MQPSSSRLPILAAALVSFVLPMRMTLAASPAEQITAFRLQHGENRVTRDAVLDRIAADQAREMAARNELSHEVLGPFGRRIAPSLAGRAAENIAYGYEDFDKTLGQWINSPPHRKNLLLHNAIKVGIASARTADGKRTYWAMEIAGDYEKPKEKGKKPPVVAQAKPNAKSNAKPGEKSGVKTAAKPEGKSDVHWGARLPSKPADCHLNIKLIGLCI